MSKPHIENILLYSGGIDSYVGYRYINDVLKQDPMKLYFQTFSAYMNEELEKISTHHVWRHVLNLSQIEDHKTANVPNRNLLLALYTTSIFDCDRIYICGTAGDRVSDNNQDIFDLLSAVIEKSIGKKVIITSPFFHLYKEEICKWWCEKYNPNDLLTDTFSCYSPKDGKECLYCKACFRKNVCLNSIGIFRTFNNNMILTEYHKEFSSCDIKNIRQIESLNYIEKVYGTKKKAK